MKFFITCALFALTPLCLAADSGVDIADPTRPALSSSSKSVRPAARVRPAHLELQSTLVSAERRLAVINGVTVAVGTRISDARVVSITATAVEVERHGRRETLRLVSGKLVTPQEEVPDAQ